MKPLLLTATAFGPFAETVAIDFTRLQGQPLFLIHGDTGAGKTSVLDALCFALYGEPTGSHRESRNLRSDFAYPDTLTEVSLTFALGVQHYRAVRTPEQERRKARGSGTRKQPPTAHLYRCDANGVETLLAEKVKEVGQAVEQLLGLSLDQFRQVIVLPQGEFQRFLYAKSTERELIFEKLFATERYRWLSDALKEQVRHLSEQLNRTRSEQQLLLTNADCADLDELTRVVLALREQTDQDQQRIIAAATAQAHLQEALGQARNLHTWHNNLRDAQLALEAHQTAGSEHQARVALLQRIDLAVAIAEQFAQFQAAATELARTSAQHTDAQAAWEAATAILGASEIEQQQVPQLQEQAQRALRAVERLQELLPLVQRHAELTLQLRQLRVDIEVKSRQREAVEAQLQQQHSEAAELTAARAARQGELRERPGALLAQRHEFDKQAEQLQTRTRLIQARHSAAEAADQARAQRDLALQQRELSQVQLAQAQRAHAQTLALELAVTLQAGAPCPVCGSLAHPRPAQGDLEKSERLAQAQQAHARDLAREQRAERELAVANAALVQATAALTAHENLGRTFATAAELQAGYETLNSERLVFERLQQLDQAQQQRLEALQRVVPQQRQRSHELAEQLLQAVRTLAGLEAALAAVTAQLGDYQSEPAALNAQIGEQQRTAQQLAERSAQLQRAHADKERAVASRAAERSQLEQARAQREQAFTSAQEQWLARLHSSEFVDQAAFIEAYTERAQAGELRQRIAGYQEQGTRLIARLEGLRADINQRPDPDLASLEAAARQAREQLEQQRTELATTVLRLTQLQQAQQRLQTLEDQLLQGDRDYQVVGTLAEHANGQREQRVSLQRFVQGAVLDQVLIEASQKLRDMSNGQYQLLRREQSSNLRSGFGLELDVEDSLTGEARPVQSLSGGESFLAALALALSLSDVVRAFAGGVQIETLFVDEGFGSLDPEALDRAMSELIKLGRQGRMVGIISHVAELKERVAARIQLSRSPQGSSVRIFAGSATGG